METVAVQILPYLTTIIGFLIVWVLNGIKSEIKDVKVSVGNLERDLREDMSLHDRRITKIEAGCAFMHGRDHENV